METARRMRYSYEEYVALEAFSSVRHEYLDGEIYAMSGGTPEHAILAARVIGLLMPQLRPECQPGTSDLRIRISETGLSTYPDGAVICGKIERAADDRLAVTNPLLLIEVTSNSSEEYDRGEKLRHYQTIPSLREVLIVSHREPRLTLHRREEDGRWLAQEALAGEAIFFDFTGARLAVDDVYRVSLATSPETS